MALPETAQLIVHSLHLAHPSFDFGADTDWPQLVHHADGHSLTPLLYATWREAGVLDQLPATIRDRMSRAYQDNAHRNSYIRHELLEIHQILDQAEVPHLVLKGWPLVEQLYSDPAQRVLYDHDFLVPADRAGIGQQALREAGFRPLPGKDEWVEKHLQPVWRNNGYPWNGYLFDPHYPRPVELHLSLWEQGWRGLRIASLANPWANTRNCAVAGTPMRLLSPENTLVHLAMHFAGHLVEREARLNQLLDLARFGQIEGDNLDWTWIVTQARQTNISRFVYASLFLAHRIFGAALPPAHIRSQLAAATPPAFQTWLAEYGLNDVLTSDYRRIEKGQDYKLTFLAAHSIVERLGIIRFAAMPPVEQLMKKYNFRRGWLGPLFYLRYMFERIRDYGRGMLSK